ncbi:MAG: ECF transporter S component [Cellulosilyticum sp.]|nr:ECF transporter S component [Cellulosilyticum sp.]
MNNASSKFNISNLRNIIIIGLFAALCYVALEVLRIPIPSPVGSPFIHMGNMFVILAALLFNGVSGGLAGSIGMGIWDIFHGYGSTAYTTFILKFGIGFFTGLVASKGNKKEAKSPRLYLGIAAAFFIIIGIVFLIIATTIGNVFDVVMINGSQKQLVISPLLYIFSLTLGVCLLLPCIFFKNMSIKMQYAILGAVSGIAFNLVGEFVFKVATLTLAGSKLAPAILASAANLPATIINGSFSIVVALVLYAPLQKALNKSGLKFA